jgi:hypothetical protein
MDGEYSSTTNNNYYTNSDSNDTDNSGQYTQLSIIMLLLFAQMMQFCMKYYSHRKKKKEKLKENDEKSMQVKSLNHISSKLSKFDTITDGIGNLQKIMNNMLNLNSQSFGQKSQQASDSTNSNPSPK